MAAAILNSVSQFRHTRRMFVTADDSRVTVRLRRGWNCRTAPGSVVDLPTMSQNAMASAPSGTGCCLARLRAGLATVLIATALVFAIEWVARGSLAATIEFFLQPSQAGLDHDHHLFARADSRSTPCSGDATTACCWSRRWRLDWPSSAARRSHYLGDPLYPTDILYARQIMELMPLLVRERPWLAVAMVAGGAAGALRPLPGLALVAAHAADLDEEPR